MFFCLFHEFISFNILQPFNVLLCNLCITQILVLFFLLFHNYHINLKNIILRPFKKLKPVFHFSKMSNFEPVFL